MASNDPEKTTPPIDSPAASPASHSPPSDWLMRSLNQIDGRLDKLDGKFDDLEGRIRKLENRIAWATGGISLLFVLLIALQIVLRLVDSSITAK